MDEERIWLVKLNGEVVAACLTEREAMALRGMMGAATVTDVPLVRIGVGSE